MILVAVLNPPGGLATELNHRLPVVYTLHLFLFCYVRISFVSFVLRFSAAHNIHDYANVNLNIRSLAQHVIEAADFPLWFTY